jgi:hemerythrin-like metal-binding protein
VELVTWNESCSVNVPEFDKDHQHLYSLVNSLHDAMLAAKAREALSDLLDELISYSQSHFVNEESFMAARNFPGLAAHAAEHAQLTQQVLEFRERFRSGTPITLGLMHFLREWLAQHIECSDKLYCVPNATGAAAPRPPEIRL